MGNSLGVYVTAHPKGKLKRDLVARSGRTPLKDSTVEQEIIEFSELDFGPYATVVDYITTTANYLIYDYTAHTSSVNGNVFDFMMDTVDDLLETFEGEDPLHGTLTRTALRIALRRMTARRDAPYRPPLRLSSRCRRFFCSSA